MDLIEQSKIDDDEKKQFAKIVRAQLGEGELFFLRYNAMTPYGKKFVNYINKYNLLKHLPILSLMEFKKFKEKMEKYKKDSSHAINMVVHKSRKEIYERTVRRRSYDLTFPIVLEKHSKYSLSVNLHDPSVTKLTIHINTKCKNTSPLFKAFGGLNVADFADFLTCLLKEVYVYSNFRMYNSMNGKVHCRPATRTVLYPFVIIEAAIEAPKANGIPTPLRLSHPIWG